MGESEYLIDTNVEIEYIGASLPEKALSKLDTIINSQFYISVINKIELFGFSGLTENETEKFTLFIDSAINIGLNRDVVNMTIEIRKAFKIKIPDAIIAATALTYDLVLITRNTADFKNIPNIRMLESTQL